MISENRKRGSRFIIFGLVLAVISVLVMNQIINQQVAANSPPPTPTPEPMAAVLYTTVDLPAHTMIQDALYPPLAADDAEAIDPALLDVCPPDIEVKSPVIGAFQVCVIPKRFMPVSAIELPEFSDDSDPIAVDAVQIALDLTGVTLESFHSSVSRGTILQRDQIVSENPASERNLPAGTIGVGIGVDSVTGAGGRVLPGQNVDVVVSYTVNRDGEEVIVTEFLLQDVEVIGVSEGTRRYEQLGQFQDPTSGAAVAAYEELLSGNRSSGTTVVLALPPEDALNLVHMTNVANEVRLLIRRPGDHEIRDVAPISTTQ